MKTYVKIEGQDVEKTVQELAKLAVNLPEVCVWDINMLSDGWRLRGGDSVPHVVGGGTIYKDAPDMAEMGSYFGMEEDEFAKKCDNIISKTDSDLKDGDIYFEWAMKPTPDQLSKLEKRIEDIINPTKMKYKIINKE